MLSNEIKRLKMKKIKFENLKEKNPEIRHLPMNHPHIPRGGGYFHQNRTRMCLPDALIDFLQNA